MNIKNLTEAITFFSAGVAAFASVWNLLLQLRGKRDLFKVYLGSVRPSIDREAMMHVVSHSDHPITLIDWGFINSDGSFDSIPLGIELGALVGDEVLLRGLTRLVEFGSIFESGYIRKEDPYGAFAVSAAQQKPQIFFDSKMSRLMRLKIRAKLLIMPIFGLVSIRHFNFLVYSFIEQLLR